MRAHILIGVMFLCLGISRGFADSPGTQCIELTPRSADPAVPRSVIEQTPASAKAFYCLALVERLEADRATPTDADIKRVFMIHATDGRYLIRILDLPYGLGRGGF